MSLFGLVYTGIVLFSKAVTGVQGYLCDLENQNDAVNKNRVTYFDHKGVERLTKSGEPVIFSVKENGERILKDWNGNVVHNYDAESKAKRLGEKQEKIKKENPNLELIGAFEDLYPSLVRKENFMFIPAKSAVYRYKGKDNYLRKSITRKESENPITGRKYDYPQYVYVRIRDCVWMFLDDDYSDDMTRYCKIKNEKKDRTLFGDEFDLMI